MRISPDGAAGLQQPEFEIPLILSLSCLFADKYMGEAHCLGQDLCIPDSQQMVPPLDNQVVFDTATKTLILSSQNSWLYVDG